MPEEGQVLIGPQFSEPGGKRQSPFGRVCMIADPCMRRNRHFRNA
jgi:hypothetical protein